MSVKILTSQELEGKLQNLHNALSSLPDSLPYSNQYYNFTSFGVLADDLDLYGTEEAVLNHVLEVTFAKEGRQKGIILVERGPGLVAVVEVLKKYNGNKPGDAVLQKWVDDLLEAAIRAGGSSSPIDPGLVEPVKKAEIGDKRKATEEEANQRKKRNLSSTALSNRKVWFIDCDPDEEEKEKGRGGRKPDPLMDEVRIFCRLKDDPTGPKYVRCAGDGCDAKWTERSGYRQRVFAHASECRLLSTSTRSKVIAALGRTAVSSDLHVRDVPSDKSASDGEGDQSASNGHRDQLKPKEPINLETAARAAGQQQLSSKITLATLKLICVRGLPPSIIDSEEWKDFLSIAAPKYKPVSYRAFTDGVVVSEAARIKTKQIDFLKTCENLTISFDGWTSAALQSIYTVHIITPERQIMLFEGDSSSDTSHTAEYIFNVLNSVMRTIGPKQFRGITSDNTGNTSRARELIRQAYPWMIILPDPCHRLNLLCKDIGKIEHFKPIIKAVKKTVKFFRKSTKANAQLKIIRKELGISAGLCSVGKTRFSSVYYSAVSVERNFKAIGELVRQKTIEIPEVGQLFNPNSFSTSSFQCSIKQLITALAPIAKATTCLESTHSTASDVYIFWLAVAAESHRLITEVTVSDVSKVVKEKIRRAVNFRFNQMVNDAPSDVYLTTFLLDPRFRNVDVMHDLNPLALQKIKIPPRSGASSSARVDRDLPESLCRAGIFLKSMLRYEYKDLGKTIGGLVVSEAVVRLKEQLIKFQKRIYPFDRTFLATRDSPAAWWKALDKDHTNDAQPLARLARSLFDLMPNSMADERTASTLTWLNSRLRNRQEAQTLIRLTKIRQWYQKKKRAEPFRPAIRFMDISKTIAGSSSQSKTTFQQNTSGSQLLSAHLADDTGLDGDNDDLRNELDDIEDESIDTQDEDDLPDSDNDEPAGLVLQDQVNLSSPLLLDLLMGDEPVIKISEKKNDVAVVQKDFEGPEIDLDNDEMWRKF